MGCGGCSGKCSAATELRKELAELRTMVELIAIKLDIRFPKKFSKSIKDKNPYKG